MSTTHTTAQATVHTPALPEVTDAHRREAFNILRLEPNGWTFARAMADDTRRRVIECLAHKLRTSEWLRTQRRTVVPVYRCRPGVDGHPLRHCTQLAPGPLAPITQPDLLDLNPEE